MKIEHICEDCGKQFEVEQGSRRKYCDKCLAKRIGKKEGSRANPPKH